MTTISSIEWKDLPEAIRELLSSEDITDRIERIGATHDLSLMEQGFLVRITASLLRGLLAPKDFVNTITEEIATPRDTALLIAKDINNDIFHDVKDALMEVHAKRYGQSVETTSITPVGKNNAPSLNSETPTPPPAATISIPAPVAEPKGSIFEQKLGGAFRMSSTTGEVTNGTGTRDSMLVAPPPPQSTPPTPPPPQPTIVSDAPKVDPYRELPA